MTAPQPETPPLTWRELADGQDQVLGRQQALAHGLTSDAWDWRIAHDWRPLGQGVAVLHTGEPTHSQLRWAAVVRTAGNAPGRLRFTEDLGVRG